MDVMIRHGRALLFVGPTGTGKTVYVKNKLLNDIDRDKYQPLVINFSAQTRAGQTQVHVRTIECTPWPISFRISAASIN